MILRDIIRKIINYIVACMFRQSVDELEHSYRRQARFDAAQKDVEDLIKKNDTYNKVVHDLAHKHSDKSGRKRAVMMAHDVSGEMQRGSALHIETGSGRIAGGSGRTAPVFRKRAGSGVNPSSKSDNSSSRSRPCHSPQGSPPSEILPKRNTGSLDGESRKEAHLFARVLRTSDEYDECTTPQSRGMSARDRLLYLNEVSSGEQSADSNKSFASAVIAAPVVTAAPVTKPETSSAETSKSGSMTESACVIDTVVNVAASPRRVSRSFTPFVSTRQISKLMSSTKIHPVDIPADNSQHEPP